MHVHVYICILQSGYILIYRHTMAGVDDIPLEWQRPVKFPYNKRGVRFSSPVIPAEVMDEIPNLRLSQKDILVAGYPKSGKVETHGTFMDIWHSFITTSIEAFLVENNWHFRLVMRYACIGL